MSFPLVSFSSSHIRLILMAVLRLLLVCLIKLYKINILIKYFWIRQITKGILED